jgi:hypothetical protein
MKTKNEGDNTYTDDPLPSRDRERSRAISKLSEMRGKGRRHTEGQQGDLVIHSRRSGNN